MDESVDSNEGCGGFGPERLSVPTSEQQIRQGHRQYLIGNPIDIAERADDGLAQTTKAVRRLGICGTQLLIDPRHQVAASNVADEQEQAVRHLVEAAVSERVPRQRAAADVVGLSTRAGPFVVPAVEEPPIPAELRAGWCS
jgi:hypothetical protein